MNRIKKPSNASGQIVGTVVTTSSGTSLSGLVFDSGTLISGLAFDSGKQCFNFSLLDITHHDKKCIYRSDISEAAFYQGVHSL